MALLSPNSLGGGYGGYYYSMLYEVSGIAVIIERPVYPHYLGWGHCKTDDCPIFKLEFNYALCPACDIDFGYIYLRGTKRQFKLFFGHSEVVLRGE